VRVNDDGARAGFFIAAAAATGLDLAALRQMVESGPPAS
jgi:hypothetical protein